MTSKPLIAMIVLAALVGSACGGGSTEPKGNGPDTTTTTPPKAIAVVFAGGTVSAELATLAAQRSTGLMNRNSIAADSGMIFVWSTDRNPQTNGFWMLNTRFDLDIAFLDANKRVINIEQMTKETTTSHVATAPFRYAVEAPRGWFAAHGVVAGATATFTIPAGVLIDP
jgi:uncharacterized membrane protein (UPF0127 family)